MTAIEEAREQAIKALAVSDRYYDSFAMEPVEPALSVLIALRTLLNATEPTGARGEAEAMYPLNGDSPDVIVALRSAYRAGVDREGRAALLDATEPPVIQYADSALVAEVAAKIAGENSELMERLADKPAEDEREALALNLDDLEVELRDALEEGNLVLRNRYLNRLDLPEKTLALIAHLREAEAVIDRVQRLADQWNDTPDYQPSDYDRGRVEQRHDMTMQLLEALDAPRDGDYHEGFEEGVKVGRAGSGPRPITDEMVEAARKGWQEAHGRTGPGTRMRAALEAAEEARR